MARGSPATPLKLSLLSMSIDRGLLIEGTPERPLEDAWTSHTVSAITPNASKAAGLAFARGGAGRLAAGEHICLLFEFPKGTGEESQPRRGMGGEPVKADMRRSIQDGVSAPRCSVPARALRPPTDRVRWTRRCWYVARAHRARACSHHRAPTRTRTP